MKCNSKRLAAILAAAFLAILQADTANADTRDLTIESAGQLGAAARRPRPLSISMIPTTSSVVSIGSQFGFDLMSTSDGYGHLYVMSASGKVQLWFENLPVRAYRKFSYPSASLVVRATAPAGDDTVVFTVTRDRIHGFAGRRTTRTPLALQFSPPDFRSALDEKTSSLPRRDWASVNTIIRVRESGR